MIVLALDLGWFPTGSFAPIEQGVLAWTRSIAHPSLALTQMGFVARMARASMLDVLIQDVVRTTDAKGPSRTLRPRGM